MNSWMHPRILLVTGKAIQPVFSLRQSQDTPESPAIPGRFTLTSTPIAASTRCLFSEACLTSLILSTRGIWQWPNFALLDLGAFRANSHVHRDPPSNQKRRFYPTYLAQQAWADLPKISTHLSSPCPNIAIQHTYPGLENSHSQKRAACFRHPCHPVVFPPIRGLSVRSQSSGQFRS